MSISIDAIAKAGKNWSIEVTPPGAAKIESFSDILAEGTTGNVTFLPGTDPVETVNVSKRLRDDGMYPVPHIAARSITSKAQLTDLVADMTSRAKVDEVLVIGGGMSGVLAAVRLQEAGIPFTVIEKNPGVGGTWFENRYPGVRVDVGNHLYCYSFEPAHHWTQYFARQPELQRYFEEVVSKHRLQDNIRQHRQHVDQRLAGARQVSQR